MSSEDRGKEILLSSSSSSSFPCLLTILLNLRRSRKMRNSHTTKPMSGVSHLSVFLKPCARRKASMSASILGEGLKVGGRTTLRMGMAVDISLDCIGN